MRNAVRLILYADAFKKQDLNTFKAAAVTLQGDYQKAFPRDDVKLIFVRSGKEIVETINKEAAGSIVSLDIVSHGNQSGIHISRKLPKPEKAGDIQQSVHLLLRRSSDRPQTQQDAEYIEESIHGFYSGPTSIQLVAYYFNQSFEKSADVGKLDSVLFDRFSDASVAEFHGCRTAEMVPVFNSYIKDNFAKNFSEKLGKKGIVIGHITNSAPDKNPNKNRNDYRYGKVRVYKNGELIEDCEDRSKLKFINSSTPP